MDKETEILEAGIKGLVTATMDRFWQYARPSFGLCETPIERQLFLALRFIERPSYDLRDDQIGSFSFCSPDIFAATARSGWPDIAFGLICPQAQIGRYRVDFALVSRAFESLPLSRIVVECDGHAFHEKTKEQAAKDKRRDRALTAEGYDVFHFTGSEIYRDAHACAREIEAVVAMRCISEETRKLDAVERCLHGEN